MRRKTGPAFLLSVGSGPPACQVSWGKPCAAGATPPKPGVECLSQFISSHEPESRMRENRPSGLGGGRRSDPFSIHILVLSLRDKEAHLEKGSRLRLTCAS